MAGYRHDWPWMTVAKFRALLAELPDDAILGPNPHLQGMTCWIGEVIAERPGETAARPLGYLDWGSETIDWYADAPHMTDGRFTLRADSEPW